MNKSDYQKYFFVLAMTVAIMILNVADGCAASIVNSKHNLSVSSPGEVRAMSETEICLFCHIPHNASLQPPLWSRYDTGQVYVPYQSTTAKATIGQPTGASKLCLTCHDGTVALGMLRSRDVPITFTGLLSNDANLGTDLSDDHPVSFEYTSALLLQDPQLNDPSTLTGPVRLDHSSQMQCTSCHDPHNDQFGDFLVTDPSNSNLCIQCHNRTGWTAASHNTSAKPYQGIPNVFTDPNRNTVAEYGCQSCHALHGAGGKERLLYYTSEELNCTHCHDGSVATKNISAEFNKLSVHPIANVSGMHDPAEPNTVTNRHVECADCHDAHAANNENIGNVSGALRNVKGIRANGTPTSQISAEHELCFRCHGDNTTGSTPYITRQFPEMNKRRALATSNISYHPVLGIGRNQNDVPSLIAPYTTESIITCGDCHNNDSGPNILGAGPNGPHGSVYPPLLERKQNLTDYTIESAQEYALCYKCHSRDNILAGSSFRKHALHILTVQAPCTACHDPHGSGPYQYLINFDRSIVSPNSYGNLTYEHYGTHRASCSLMCHGQDHIGID